MLNNVNLLISQQLDRITKERKLKDADILRKCGFTRPTLIKIKNGGNINVETLAALASGLGVKISFFFDEEITIEKKDFYNSGERSLLADHIDKVDMRDQRTHDEKVKLNKPSYEELETKVAELQNKLLEAQSKIISLMENKQS